MTKLDQNIKNRILAEFGENRNGMKFKKWLKDNQDVSDYLNSVLKADPRYESLGNVVWCLLHDFDIDEYKCKTCGKHLSIKYSVTQQRKYCSSKCAMNDPELQNRRKETISADPTFYKKRHDKIRKTNLERYGVDIPAKAESVRNKMKEAWAKDEHFWEKRSEKIKKTNMERYGVDNAFQIKHVVDKSRHSHRKESFKFFERFKDIVVPMFTEEEYLDADRSKLKWKCMKCGLEFEQGFREKANNNSDNYCMPRCPVCYPNHMSMFQKEVTDFCKQFFSEILENDRKTIKPYELDIVIPSLKLAIECNGIYWHSARFHEYKYGTRDGYHNHHLDKVRRCEEAGYRLIQIWEDDWGADKEAIKEKLKQIFTGVEPHDYEGDRVELSREWHSAAEKIPGYRLVEETEPKTMTRGTEEVEDSGTLIFERVQP